jgi:hypothetical protein
MLVIGRVAKTAIPPIWWALLPELLAARTLRSKPALGRCIVVVRLVEAMDVPDEGRAYE